MRQRKARGKVAVLGPEGTFTETAAKKMFEEPALEYKDNVEEVFKYADSGKGTGVVAIENSLEGSVTKTLEALMEYDVKICGETTIEINLCLIKKPETKEIKAVLSHPHALAQCKNYIKNRYSKARLQPTDSTVAAIKELRGTENAAAIGPKQAAEKYGLEIAEENIQDDKSQTRFVAISREECSGKKTSLIYSLKDEPGALYDTLKVFAEKNINLTKIESRPSRKKLGEYVFYVDFENNGLDKQETKKLLEKIREKTTFMKYLGSY